MTSQVISQTFFVNFAFIASKGPLSVWQRLSAVLAKIGGGNICDLRLLPQYYHAYCMMPDWFHLLEILCRLDAVCES
jgi:hypothetical protein